MTLQEVCILISQLENENKTNSDDDKEFNNRWIAVLKKTIIKAL